MERVFEDFGAHYTGYSQGRVNEISKESYEKGYRDGLEKAKEIAREITRPPVEEKKEECMHEFDVGFPNCNKCGTHRLDVDYGGQPATGEPHKCTCLACHRGMKTGHLVVQKHQRQEEERTVQSSPLPKQKIRELPLKRTETNVDLVLKVNEIIDFINSSL